MTFDTEYIATPKLSYFQGGISIQIFTTNSIQSKPCST
jgi:hypothetical protein